MTLETVLRFAKGTVTENLGLKVVSLALSVGLYAYHHGASNAERSFSVGVVSFTPPEDKGRALVTQVPSTVRVTFRGSRSSLDDLRTDDLGAVELNLRRGTESFATFDPSQLRVPPGVVARVDPPGIEVTWDDVVSREVPIVVPLDGHPVAGFAVVGEPSVDPTRVLARGPRSIVETLQSVKTESFELSGLVEGLAQRKLPLDTPPSRVSLDQRSVTVTVRVDRAREERLFPKVPVQVVGPARAQVVPAEIDVRVAGPPSVVATLRADLIVPTIDVRALGGDPQKPGSLTGEPKVAIDGCTITLVPSSVVVKW